MVKILKKLRDKHIRVPSIFGGFFQNKKIAESAKNIDNHLPIDNSKLLSSVIKNVTIKLPNQNKLVDSIAEKVRIQLPRQRNMVDSLIEKVKITLPGQAQLIDIFGLKSHLEKTRVQVPDISDLLTKPAVEVVNLDNIEKIKVKLNATVSYEQMSLDRILESQSSMLKEMLEKQKETVKKTAEGTFKRKQEKTKNARSK